MQPVDYSYAVAGGQHHQAEGRKTVAARTAGFLNIRLQTGGGMVMHYGTHVRLVNPHAESNRRHQHVRRACQKLVLNQPPRFRRHARMVGLDGKTGFPQFVGKVFRIFAGPRVHHGGTTAFLFQQFNQPRGLILLPQRFHLTENIRTVRSSPENTFIAHAKQAGQIAAHPLRSRGRQRHDAAEPVLSEKNGQPQIIRTETVPPFRKAMSLIHHEQAGRDKLHGLLNPRGFQRFRRGKQKADASGRQSVHQGGLIFLRQGRIIPGGGHPQSFQPRHLVAHQGNQRRNHNRQPVSKHRRNLIAKALAGTRRQNTDAGTALQRTLHQLPLHGTEPLLAEQTQRVFQSRGKHGARIP